MSGKGSAPRPYSVPKDQFDAAFEKIFGTPKKKSPDEPGKREKDHREGKGNDLGDIVCQ